MKNIIKALKHCVDKDCEEGCPYDLNGCYGKLADDTITLLTNQKEEIERLQKLLDEKCDIIKDKESSIERLQADNIKLHTIIPKMIITAKFEAIKEFAERLKATDTTDLVGEQYINGEIYGYFYSNAFETKIDNLAKELTEKG